MDDVNGSGFERSLRRHQSLQIAGGVCNFDGSIKFPSDFCGTAAAVSCGDPTQLLLHVLAPASKRRPQHCSHRLGRARQVAIKRVHGQLYPEEQPLEGKPRNTLARQWRRLAQHCVHAREIRSAPCEPGVLRLHHWQVFVGTQLAHQFTGVVIQSLDAREVAESALDDGVVHQASQLVSQIANPSGDPEAAFE